MKMLKSALLVAALMTVAGTVRAESPLPLPMAASPEEVGLSSVQLKRLEAVTKAHIDGGLVPGAVMLVARRGKVAWVSVQGKRVDLRPTEFNILALLMGRKGHVWTYQALGEALSQGTKDMTSEHFYNHFKNLRAKLGSHGKHIETVHSIGYKFAE